MIDIQRIKDYNSTLEKYKEEAHRVQMEKAVADREIDRLCAELSEELQVKVTRDNARELYKKYLDLIENTVASGEEIFERVQAEAEYARGINCD